MEHQTTTYTTHARAVGSGDVLCNAGLHTPAQQAAEAHNPKACLSTEEVSCTRVLPVVMRTFFRARASFSVLSITDQSQGIAQ